jgi:hypothetical protein
MAEINEENLLSAGYRKSSGERGHNHSDWLFQKRFRDAEGNTLYFINVWQYIGLHRGYSSEDGWMPEIQLYLERSRWLSVKLGGFRAIEDVESFVAEMYEKLNCQLRD